MDVLPKLECPFYVDRGSAERDTYKVD
jgi:hypothetical protein